MPHPCGNASISQSFAPARVGFFPSNATLEELLAETYDGLGSNT
jgi:hypothetical protein